MPMHHLLEKDLLNTLAQWVNRLRNPYETSNPSQETSITLRPGSFPDSTLHISTGPSQTLSLTIVHPLACLEEEDQLRAFRKESKQFNLIMEQVRLPVYVWENKSDNRFELRWEEKLANRTELEVLSTLFKQSLYLSNVLSSRLGWGLAQKSIPKTLH